MTLKETIMSSKVSERARELLAAELDASGMPICAKSVRCNIDSLAIQPSAAARVIERLLAALGRYGVHDDNCRRQLRGDYAPCTCGFAEVEPVRPLDDEENWRAIEAVMTGAATSELVASAIRSLSAKEESR